MQAFWSEFASAHTAQVHFLCASVTAAYLPFFVFEREQYYYHLALGIFSVARSGSQLRFRWDLP